MHPKIDLTALVLSTVCVTDQDGHPLTATGIAFLLDVPQDEADRSLRELIADGSIERDGDLLRLRFLSPADVIRIERLHKHLEQLRPIVEMIPVRLDN
jgi:DNA-binding IclR family transcriptional regulator